MTTPTSSLQGLNTSNLQPVLKFATSPSGLMLLASLAAFGLLNYFGGSSKKKAKGATGYFGQGAETRAARQLAQKQMKLGQRNSVALYLGRPKVREPLYLPDAQRGTAVCGGPGSGKTFSVIDPAVRSALDQDFPVILYDFKYPTQTSRIAGYAAKLGYQVRVFAPGFPESDVCNPLDFLKDETDSLMARQLSVVMNRNFASGGDVKSEDPFFTQAGDQLTEAIFMLAKGTAYPDIMMCQALLSIDDLPGRLQAQAENLNPWVRSAFGQLMSVAKSEKTVASIIATANTNFTRFMKQDILGAFTGQTTIPLDLSGKQLLIMGMDRERRDVVGPLLATILHLIVTRNVVKPRQHPLVLSLDELPTLFLPSLVQWLNENREDGLVTVLGFQNMAQLEKTYGEELSRAIIGGCGTKAIFNPQEYQSAEVFSNFLGDEEIEFKQKSRGRSSGKGNTNISDQNQTRKLFEPSRFLKLPTGQCILINPGYRNAREAGVPLLKKIQLPKAELQAIEDSKQRWKKLQETLKSQLQHRRTPTKEDLVQRFNAADRLLSPVDKSGKLAQSKIDIGQLISEALNDPI